MLASNSKLQHVTHMQFIIFAYTHTHTLTQTLWGGQRLSRMPDEPQRDLGGSSHIPSARYDAHTLAHGHTMINHT